MPHIGNVVAINRQADVAGKDAAKHCIDSPSILANVCSVQAVDCVCAVCSVAVVSYVHCSSANHRRVVKEDPAHAHYIAHHRKLKVDAHGTAKSSRVVAAHNVGDVNNRACREGSGAGNVNAAAVVRGRIVPKHAAVDHHVGCGCDCVVV